MNLKVIREALERATPGPWGYEGDHMGLDLFIHDRDDNILAEDLTSTANAHLIANAPTWLKELCDEVERLRRELALRDLAKQAQDLDMGY